MKCAWLLAVAGLLALVQQDGQAVVGRQDIDRAVAVYAEHTVQIVVASVHEGMLVEQARRHVQVERQQIHIVRAQVVEVGKHQVPIQAVNEEEAAARGILGSSR